MRVFAENKRIFFDYEILETREAGMVLTGQEVKSIKSGKINLAGSFVSPRIKELFLIGCQISPYQPKNAPADYNPERPRKLLLKKEEIRYLIGKIGQKGLTLAPLKVYTKKDKIKLEIAVVKRRKKVNKKELLKKRGTEREIKRELKIRG